MFLSTETFSPSTIAAGSPATTVTLIIQTGNSSAQALLQKYAGKSAPLALGLLLWPLWRVRGRAGLWIGLLIVLGGLAALAVLTGCGGPSRFTQSIKSYAITITVTSGSVTHSTITTINIE